MEQNLLEKLRRYSEAGQYAFHMPGHKQNLPFAELAAAARLDITEIDGFDNLHAPRGILREAMERAASLYGAGEALYSVNGSTAALQIAMAAAVKPCGKVIMARNCHRAAYHGLYLGRFQPVYLYPQMLSSPRLADVVTPEAVEEALLCHPDAEAVLIVSPTCDGLCADVGSIAGAAHRHGATLIVDCAHGAHLGLHPNFLESPVRLGADLTVVSLHKTLPSLTQTALLLVQGQRVDRERLSLFSRIYQSSSPSYLLMGCMDACVSWLLQKGKAAWDDFFRFREEFLRRAGAWGRIRVWTAEQPPATCGAGMDACKLLIGPKGDGQDGPLSWEESGKPAGDAALTGPALLCALRRRFGLEMEMAGLDTVTAIVTCCDTASGWERLGEALEGLDRDRTFWEDVLPAGAAAGEGPEEAPSLQADRKWLRQGAEGQMRPREGIPLWQAMDAPKEYVPLSRAAGRLCGDLVELYPPGVPIVVAGEELTEPVLTWMQTLALQGLEVTGLRDGCVPVVA